jgi:NhaP-type Na+/H+ or K+/H+ antiporter
MLPLVLVALSGAEAAAGAQSGAHDWMTFAALQVTLGPLVGVAVGWSGGRLVERARRGRWMTHAYERLSVLGFALLAYAGAEFVGGNGFIAAFVGGLALGNTSRGASERLLEFGETEGLLFTSAAFAMFGAMFIPAARGHIDVAVVGNAIASLTIVRALPVAASLVGKRLGRETVAFVAWFGPRGIASILYALLVVESQLPHAQDIVAIITVTVALSVFAHGVSATPWAKHYGRRSAQRSDTAESAPVSELPPRMRHHARS